MSQKPALHGWDHRLGGADPIPGVTDLKNRFLHWGTNTDTHSLGVTLNAPSGPFDWDGQGATFETNANGFGVDTEDADGFFGGFNVNCGGVEFDLHDGLDYTIDFTGGGGLIVTGDLTVYGTIFGTLDGGGP